MGPPIQERGDEEIIVTENSWSKKVGRKVKEKPPDKSKPARALTRTERNRNQDDKFRQKHTRCVIMIDKTKGSFPELVKRIRIDAD